MMCGWHQRIQRGFVHKHTHTIQKKQRSQTKELTQTTMTPFCQLQGFLTSRVIFGMKAPLGKRDAQKQIRHLVDPGLTEQATALRPRIPVPGIGWGGEGGHLEIDRS